MITVQDFPDITRPSQVRHGWHGLWQRTPQASFRQTPDFWESQSNTLGERWRILMVSAWERPIGLVPLVERSVRRSLGTFRLLTLPESAWGFFPSPVGPHSATTLAAVVRHLVQRDHSWDMLELPEIVRAGTQPTRILQAFETSSLTSVQRRGQLLRRLALPARWSQFWSNRTAAARQRWRELDLLLSRRGVVRFVRFRPDGIRSGDTDRDWSTLNWLEHIPLRQAEGLPANQAQATLRRLRDLHPAAVDAGCADIAMLMIDARPVAAAYNIRCHSCVETLYLLADPQVPDAADVLIGQMLRDEIVRGDTSHLFLPNSTDGLAVDWSLWQGAKLHETIVTHFRRASIRLRLLRWLDKV
jgi:hypothetical protein